MKFTVLNVVFFCFFFVTNFDVVFSDDGNVIIKFCVIAAPLPLHNALVNVQCLGQLLPVVERMPVYFAANESATKLWSGPECMSGNYRLTFKTKEINFTCPKAKHPDPHLNKFNVTIKGENEAVCRLEEEPEIVDKRKLDAEMEWQRSHHEICCRFENENSEANVIMQFTVTREVFGEVKFPRKVQCQSEDQQQDIPPVYFPKGELSTKMWLGPKCRSNKYGLFYGEKRSNIKIIHVTCEPAKFSHPHMNQFYIEKKDGNDVFRCSLDTYNVSLVVNGLDADVKWQKERYERRSKSVLRPRNSGGRFQPSRGGDREAGNKRSRGGAIARNKRPAQILGSQRHPMIDLNTVDLISSVDDERKRKTVKTEPHNQDVNIIDTVAGGSGHANAPAGEPGNVTLNLLEQFDKGKAHIK